MSSIRNYKDSDYEAIKELYNHSEWFGGQFDEARDSRERLAEVSSRDPEAIQVYETKGRIKGTISLIEDGRVAWLFRFVAAGNDPTIAKLLYQKAVNILKTRGHTQVLVYSPLDDAELDARYRELGMNKGDNFTSFWKDI